MTEMTKVTTDVMARINSDWTLRGDATIEDVVEVARALRLRAEHAELEFMFFLQAVERNYRHLWGGYGSFPDFITRCSLCRPERYARFHQVAESLGVSVVSEIGVSGAVVVAQVPEESRPEAVERFAAFRETHGTAISEQHAKTMARDLLPAPAREPRAVGQVKRMHDLQAEVTALREQNEALKAEVTSLRERIAEMTRERRERPRARS